MPLLLAMVSGLLTPERASGQETPVAPAAASAVTTEESTSGQLVVDQQAAQVSAQEAGATPEAVALAPIPLERQPYRVLLVWGVDEQSGPIPAPVLAELGTGWSDSAARLAGPLWETSVAKWPAAWPVSQRGLAEVTATQVSTLADQQADVILLAVIGASHDGLVVRSRVWQPLLDWETPVETNVCREPRALGDLLAGVAYRSMRWHGLVERRPDRQWQIVMQGLDLLGSDQTSPVAPGSLLSMTVEQLQHGAGPEPVIDRRTPVRWTFFEVRSVAQGIAQGRVLSGVRSPLPERPRRRLRTRAATVPTWGDTTTLELVVRGTQPRIPLAALRVELAVEQQARVETAAEDGPTTDNKPTTRTVLKTIANRVTDRRGQVPITASSGHGWQWVTVWSGTQRLARIPCLPGEAPRLELELPDDRPRLAVETELAAIELALIETVARRSAQLAALRRQARGDDAVGALKKLDTIASGWLTREAVRSQIAGVRVAGAAVARAQGNRESIKRIEQLCQQLTSLADEHLTEPIPSDLRLEITDLANLQAQTAADIQAAPVSGPRRRIE